MPGQHSPESNVGLYPGQTINITHMSAGYMHYRGSARLTDVRPYGAADIYRME